MLTSVKQSSHQKKRILLISRTYPPVKGATGRHLDNLAGALAGAGHNVTVLTTGDKSETELDDRGVTVLRVKFTGDGRSLRGNLWLLLLLFGRGLLLKRHDVVVSLSDPLFLIWPAALLSILKWSKHVHWCHDLYPDLLPALNYKLWSPVQKMLQGFTKLAYKSCSKIVVLGRCMEKTFLDKGINRTKLAVIPNWYDPALDRSWSRHDSFSHDKFRVLYAGSMGRAHPAKTLLNAAKILYRTDPDIEFVFVGEGEELDKLASSRARFGLENIKFLPYQPEDKLYSLLESGDVHLITMRAGVKGKLVPCKFYSTLAVKRPCLLIGPADNEVSYVMEEYAAGITIPNDEVNMLVNAVRHLRDNGEDWRHLHQGAARAGQVYTPQASLDKWTSLIQEL